MRVLHILTRLNRSGMERMLECSYDLWVSAGVEPIILGMSDGNHPYAPALQARGYRVVETHAVRSVRGLNGLRRSVRAIQPDIVHIHQESCFDAVAVISRLSPGVDGLVYTVHNSFPFEGSLRARRSARAGFSRRIGLTWVACAEQVAENERSRFGNPTLVVENWVDVEALASGATDQAGELVRRSLGVPAEAPVLGLIGNCDVAKNHELIPEALNTVLSPVHVLHIGDRSRTPPAESASWPHLPERHTVHHLGPRDDIPGLLAACDLLLLPSRYEGLPLVAIEALCARVPVLAADVLPLEWLRAFPAATLAPLSPGIWGAAIQRMLSRDWSAEAELSAQAAQVRFNPARGVAEYAALYKGILPRWSSAHSSGPARGTQPSTARRDSFGTWFAARTPMNFQLSANHRSESQSPNRRICD